MKRTRVVRFLIWIAVGAGIGGSACGALGNSPSKGLAEVNFTLSNGYTLGVEVFTHPAVDSSDCVASRGYHSSPGFERWLFTSLKADSCAEVTFAVPAGYIEAVTLSGLNCRFGNSSYDCGAILKDADTGKVLATVTGQHDGWYSAPVQSFPVHTVMSGHLTVRVEQHAQGQANYDHKDYPPGNGSVKVWISAPDGKKFVLDATLTHPGPDDSPTRVGFANYITIGTWGAKIETKQSASMYISTGGATAWPYITIDRIKSDDQNPYEIGLFVEDLKTHAILAYVNYKATGVMVRPASTFPLQNAQSGEIAISVYMWEVHSANWLNAPLASEALDVLVVGQ